jgi:D-alanine-D-alanine ligase
MDEALVKDCPEVIVVHNPAEVEGPEGLAEAEVLETAAAVEDALASRGWRTRRLELPRPISHAASAMEGIPPSSAVFNLFEGYPEDSESEIQVGFLLKSLRLRSTGCPPEAMLLGLHKALSKEVLQSAGLDVAPYRLLLTPGDLEPDLPFPFPAFLKPAVSDASHGVGPDSVVRDRGAFEVKARDLLSRFRGGVLAEPYLPGREICCGVVEAGGVPVPLPPTLVDYSALPPGYPPVLTFEAKWDTSSPLYDQTPTLCPAPAPPELISRLQEIAAQAFLALGCRGCARIDFREDGQGRWFIMEANPNPAIHPDAGMPKQARERGWDYADLVEAILRAAVEGEPWA